MSGTEELRLYALCRIRRQGLASGQPPGENGQPVVTGSGGGPVNIGQSTIMSQQSRTLREPIIAGMQASFSYNPSSQPRDPRSSSLYNPAAQMYQSYPQKVSPAPTASQLSGSYPIHPDVRFKSLPFYDFLGELLKPSSLMPQNNQRIQDGGFVFHLTPLQANEIALSKDSGPGSKTDYVVQVQMRFCLLETSCEQEDCFPPGVVVKLNGKLCPLPNPIPTNKPGVEPKRPPRPVNVTNYVRLSPTVTNHVNITWAAEYGRGYAVGIYLVRKLTSTQLLQRLKGKGIRHADYTTGLIKEKLNEDLDIEIATTSLRVSLICPLGKMRMSTPCRASTCSHLQCFDASLFLQMNERKPTWVCPVCDKPCLFDKLVIDGYFQEVLHSSQLPSDVTEVQLHQDGSWSVYNLKKDGTRVLSPAPQSSRKPVIPTIIETIPVDEIDVVPADTDDVIAEGSSSSNSSSVTATTGAGPATSATSNKVATTGTTSSSGNKEAPKRKAIIIDLTLTDSDEDDDDDRPLVKRINSGNSGGTISITKSDPSLSSSSSTNLPASASSNIGFTSNGSGRLFNTDSNSNLSLTGRSSVTSSGYISPNIITLDSPSPPPIPCDPASPVISTHNNNSNNSSSGGGLASSGSSGTNQSQVPQQSFVQPPMSSTINNYLENDPVSSGALFYNRY